MKIRRFLQNPLFMIIELSLLLLIVAPGQAIAQQQNPRFLQSPYYGSKGLSSWFDHQVPTYAIDHALVIYTGDSRAVDDNETCFSGWNGNCYDGHPGIDFLTGYDQILAAADGQVIWAGWPSPLICHNGPICGLGLHIIIEHNINNVVYRTIYGHLSVIGVQEGDNIKAGQVIGSSGSTGSSTGPHLHFEVQVFENNLYRRIDPFGWQTTNDSDIRIDPWSTSVSGTSSWCMWSVGQWANICDQNQAENPIPTPIYWATTIIDDNNTNSNGFNKGYGGLWQNSCTGANPSCQKWWARSQGYLSDSFFSIASGNTTPSNWAEWNPDLSANYIGLYEIFVYTPDLGPTYTSTWQAQYKIVDANGGTHTAIVDQFVGAGQNYNPYNKWLSIGIYQLNHFSYIYLTDATGEIANTHCPNGPVWPVGATNC